MLEYVKELKTKCGEMMQLDNKIIQKKKELKVKIKQGDITLNQKNALKQEIVNLIHNKIKIYFDVCKIAKRYEVFGLDKILGVNLREYRETSLIDYIDYSYSDLKNINKEIIKDFGRSNSPFTQYISYNSDVVEIDKLMQKCTGDEWEIISIKSPYVYEDVDDYEFYYVKSKYLLAVNKKYINNFKKVDIDKEKLEKFILDKKCVLLRNIWCYENGTNNYNYLKQSLVFCLALNAKNNNVYEGLYPNLKECFWDLLNDTTLQQIKNEIDRHKDKIKYNEKQIVNIQNEIKESQDYINNYKQELDSQK